MEYMHQLFQDNEKHSNSNSKLYEFLATNYDISDLAQKISAAKNAKLNLLSLKKISMASSA